jgi:hypothetical protein
MNERPTSLPTRPPTASADHEAALRALAYAEFDRLQGRRQELPTWLQELVRAEVAS